MLSWDEALVGGTGDGFTVLVGGQRLVDIEVYRFGQELDVPIGEYEIRATWVVASKRHVVVGGVRQAPGGITDVRIDRMSSGTYDATYRALVVPVTFIVRRNVAFVPMPPDHLHRSLSNSPSESHRTSHHTCAHS